MLPHRRWDANRWPKLPSYVYSLKPRALHLLAAVPDVENNNNHKDYYSAELQLGVRKNVGQVSQQCQEI
jgi:hypothetical protein